MSQQRRIIIFGISGIKSIKTKFGEMIFVDPSFSRHLAEYDIIVYWVGTFKHELERGAFGRPILKTVPPEAVRRENEVRLALERGKTVCVIGVHAEDYVVAGLFSSFGIHYRFIHDADVFRNIEIRRSEFKPFVGDVGATQIEFDKDSVDDAICYVGQSIVGFSKRMGNGILFFLPCIWGSKDSGYVTEHFERLVAGLVSYSAKLIVESPSYVHQFLFTKEKGVREEIRRITKEQIVPLEKNLAFYAGLKSILWLGDRNLVGATDGFLKNMGFQTSVDEISEEDLWVMNGQERLIVVEVKGLNKNLTRQDISKLDQHREAREVPDLTGLLIANTFMTADSLESKDQPFPPNVIEKAVSANLLITRTIDLCRIFDHLEQKKHMPSKVLLETILGKKGWLTFNDGTIRIIC